MSNILCITVYGLDNCNLSLSFVPSDFVQNNGGGYKAPYMNHFYDWIMYETWFYIYILVILFKFKINYKSLFSEMN